MIDLCDPDNYEPIDTLGIDWVKFLIWKDELILSRSISFILQDESAIYTYQDKQFTLIELFKEWEKNR